jgi:heat shock protein HslJ
MTDLRALDRVQPPDLWPDILDRAATPGREEPGRGRNRILLAAAVVVVLAGLVGGLVVTQLGGDDAAPTEEPASLWGQRWQLQTLVEDGTPIDLGGESAGLDLRREGRIWFSACNSQGGSAQLVDGRLEVGEIGGTEAACGGVASTLDQVLRGLIEASPTVEVSAGRLVLRSPSTEAVFAPVAVDEAAFWGHVWNLEELSVGEDRVEVPDGVEGTIARSGSTAPYLDTTQVGEVGYGGCGGGGLDAHLEGERLVADDDWGQEGRRCDVALMDVDDVIAALLVSDPIVDVDEGRLTILGGGTLAAFTDAEADGPVLLWPGTGSCSAGFEGGPILLAGPHRPAVIDLGSGIGPAYAQGTWHATIGRQRVELQAPLVPVIDYVGDRTEDVVLDSGDSAIVWYRTFDDGKVAVRTVLEQTGTESCPSFDLTVVGGTEQANRDLAVDLANRLVLADF